MITETKRTDELIVERAKKERRRVLLSRPIDIKSNLGNGWFLFKIDNKAVAHMASNKFVMMSSTGRKNPVRKYRGIFK